MNCILTRLLVKTQNANNFLTYYLFIKYSTNRLSSTIGGNREMETNHT